MKKIGKLLLKSLLGLFVLFNIMVIFHAYKLTHFYDAASVAAEKAAPKTGWSKAAAIFMGAKAPKAVNIAPDTAVQNITLTAANRLKLSAWHLPASPSKGTVALFHGHGSKKSALLGEAAVFRKLGYSTLLVDFRAHGNSEGNACTIGYEEAEDVKLAYDYLVKHGEKNIVLYGASLGAATITKAVNDYALQPQKVILEMPFASLYDAVKGRLKIMNLPQQPLAAMLTFWGGTMHGFVAFNLRPAEYVKKMPCPVLLQWGRNDPRVSLAETEKIYRNIPSGKKLVVYENSGHESYLKREPLKWTNEVSAFLQ
ncbi:MAG: alpha/beta hydrolase [Chitinophagaceae bacterium]|nr:MAG: alpha/beta hydrolase [Chitinophagaceae bacterium]